MKPKLNTLISLTSQVCEMIKGNRKYLGVENIGLESHSTHGISKVQSANTQYYAVATPK